MNICHNLRKHNPMTPWDMSKKIQSKNHAYYKIYIPSWLEKLTHWGLTQQITNINNTLFKSFKLFQWYATQLG